MKTCSWIFALLLPFLLYSCKQQEDKVYMFSYFVDNGQDGLHLAYSYDGLEWTALNDNNSFLTPEAGNDKLMRDPCIIHGPDGNFHMVWTVSWNEKGIGYARSQDLINWSQQKFIPVMTHEPEARNCWAPEIFYDEEQDRYMIYWATTIPGRFPETDSTGDNGYNHRMYYTTTKDFEDFSETRLLYDQGFNVIDAVVAKDGNTYVMVLKDETRYPPQKNLHIATSRQLAAGYSKPSTKITGEEWVEGPTVTRVNGDWVVYFDRYRARQMGAIKSKDLKTWEDISEQVSFPEGTRHGTVFQVDKNLLDKLLTYKK